MSPRDLTPLERARAAYVRHMEAGVGLLHGASLDNVAAGDLAQAARRFWMASSALFRQIAAGVPGAHCAERLISPEIRASDRLAQMADDVIERATARIDAELGSAPDAGPLREAAS